MPHRKLVLFAWSVAVLLGLGLSLELVQTRHARLGVEALALQQGQAEAKAAALQIDQQLATYEGLAHELRRELETGSLKPQELPRRVADSLGHAPEACLRLGVLFQPYASDPKIRLFGPYAARDTGALLAYGYERDVDYSAQDWFKLELAQPGWSERHFSHEGSLLLVDFAEPFQLPGADRPSGTIRLEVSLNAIRRLVARANVGASGYSFLVSGKGVFLADPTAELVRKGRTLLELAEDLKDPGRRFLGQKVPRGEAGFAESLSRWTGQKTWIFLEPVPRAHWSLGTVFLKDELAALPGSAKGHVVRLVSLGVGLLLALAYLTFNARNPSLAHFWHAAVAGSVVIALGTAALWHFAYTMPHSSKGQEVPVVDQTTLQTLVNRYGQLEAGLSDHVAELIPTGIFLESMDLAGAGQVRVTGKVWQRFRKGGPPEAQTGLTFPEAVSGDVDKPVAREVGKDVILLSSFKVVLKQNLVSSPNYPFDHARVRLWIRPKAQWRNEMLVPDLGAYQLLIPSTLPGLDHELRVSGWKVERSFFSYLLQNYNANFGMDDYVGQQQSPELLFNVTMRREFLNPFIATFLPIMAVLGLLFATVLTITRDPDKLKTTSYQCLNFLRTVVTLFFPLVVAQINLRSKIDADRLIYLEHYYFVVYALILLTSVDALLFALGKHRLVAYEDNALAKLAFWPFLLTCFYLVSIQFLL
jgi:hypothetical protein